MRGKGGETGVAKQKTRGLDKCQPFQHELHWDSCSTSNKEQNWRLVIFWTLNISLLGRNLPQNFGHTSVFDWNLGSEFRQFRFHRLGDLCPIERHPGECGSVRRGFLELRLFGSTISTKRWSTVGIGTQQGQWNHERQKWKPWDEGVHIEGPVRWGISQFDDIVPGTELFKNSCIFQQWHTRAWYGI